jgi:integrase
MSGKLPVEGEKLAEFRYRLKFSVDEVIYDFFEIQLQFGLRFADCESLSIAQARYCLRHGTIDILEQKTGKVRKCDSNEVVDEIFRRRVGGKTLWSGMVHRTTYAAKLKMVAVACGLDPARISTHSVRKSFAVAKRDAGVPIELISEQMLHDSVETTRIYCGFNEKKVRGITATSI